jgi:hypothetical protein
MKQRQARDRSSFMGTIGLDRRKWSVRAEPLEKQKHQGCAYALARVARQAGGGLVIDPAWREQSQVCVVVGWCGGVSVVVARSPEAARLGRAVFQLVRRAERAPNRGLIRARMVRDRAVNQLSGG